MFSNLGPLFKTVFRQAESTDTRQAIRREEKEQGRGNKEAQEDTHISVNLWEDNTSVSVTSLQAFLIDFLKDKTFSDKADISNQMAPFQTQQQKPQNTFVARATNAYQTMAEQTQSRRARRKSKRYRPLILSNQKRCAKFILLLRIWSCYRERG